MNDYKVQKANLKKKSIPAGRCPAGAAGLPKVRVSAGLLASELGVVLLAVAGRVLGQARRITGQRLGLEELTMTDSPLMTEMQYNAAMFQC